MEKTFSPAFAARTMTSGWSGLRALLEEENKGDGAANGTGGGGGGTTTKTPEQRIAELEGALTSALGKLKDVEKAEADRAAAATAAEQKAADDKLIAEGKLKQLIEQKDTELASLRPLADLGKQAQADAEKRFTEAKAKLQPADQVLVDAAAPAQREALIARLSAASTPTITTPKPNPGTGVPGPGGGAPDFAEALKGGEESWRAAKARDPEGARKWLTSSSAPEEGPNRPLAHLPRPAAKQ